MSKKATVVYLKRTGHVLAAATTVSDPGTTPTLTQLVTDELVVRGLPLQPAPGTLEPKEFHIATDDLKVASVDALSTLLASPYLFAVDDPKSDSPNLTGPVSAASTTPQIDMASTSLTATNTLTVAITVPGTATGLDKATPFWCQIEGVDPLGRPAIQVIKFDYPDKTKSQAFTLSPSLAAKTNYLVILALAGSAIVAGQKSTP